MMKPSINSTKPQRQPRSSSRSSSHVHHSTSAAAITATGDPNCLSVQSSPMQLATRSLSARTFTSTSTHSSQSAESARSLTRHPATSVPGSHRRRKRSHDSRKRTEGKKMVVEPLKLPSEKGFNIADHLRNSADNSRHGGSTSPDVHQLLKDISSIMRSVSPMHEPSHLSPPQNSEQGTGSTMHPQSSMQEPSSPSPRLHDSEQWQTNGHMSKTKGQTTASKPSRKANLRLKVAANFNQDPVTLTTMSNEDADGGGQVEHHRSKGKKPKIPLLNIGGSDQPEAPQSVGGLHGGQGGSGRDSVGSAAHRSGRGNFEGPGSATKQSGSGDAEEPDAVTKKEVLIPAEGAEEVAQESMITDGCSDEGSSKQQAEAVRSLLEEKRVGLSRSRLEELERAQIEVEAQERKQLEREQRRAARLKADRKAAIEELKKRREEKRVLQERLAQEEVSLLQASGKVKKPRGPRVKKSNKAEDSEMQQKPKEVEMSSPDDKLVDEFFEAGNVKPTSSAAISPPPPISKLPMSSTYDEIMDTLRLLEEVPAALEPSVSTTPAAAVFSAPDKWMVSQRGGRTAAETKKLSDGKLESILSYLDQVERVEVDRSNQLAQPIPASSLLQTPSASTAAQQVNEVSELEAAAATANDVTATILAQRMELDSKTKTVGMLEKALSQQRELTVYHAKEMEKEGQKRLQLQKAEYEATVQRHQCFIDQLIEDKKVLSERCEQLVGELKDLDKKCKTKLSILEETHAAEISKLKQVSAAADKLRREKWRSEETQRIKEATVKGLEPEIQRIIAKGKAEVQRLKALHEAELMQADERASRRFVAQMEEVREQCAVEKEQACAHERELARQRYEKMAEQEELNYQQQRRRLFGEVAQEKEKMADQLHRQKETFALKLQEALELHERHIEELRLGHRQEKEEWQLRHRAELRSKEEGWEAQRLTWEENLLRSQEAEMMAKERELRAKLREDRDKEIEMVISRLESETASAKEEAERTAESRVRRIREKYEAEMKEVERSEKNTLEKYNAMKSQVVELEGEVTLLQSRVRQRDQEVERIGEVASKLTQERDSVADIVRQEFADRLVSTEEENKQLKIEMSELRARHKVELERERKTKAKELEEVHQRVKQALEKKEENLNALKEQHEGAVKRAEHLQMLLQRQRTQLLKK